MGRGAQAIFRGDRGLRLGGGGAAGPGRGRGAAGAREPPGTRKARAGRIAAAAAGHMTAGSASAPPASPRSCLLAVPSRGCGEPGRRASPPCAHPLSLPTVRGGRPTARARETETEAPRPTPGRPASCTGAGSPAAEPGAARSAAAAGAAGSRVLRLLQRRRPLPPSCAVAGRRGPARERRAEWAGAASTRSGRCPCSCW